MMEQTSTYLKVGGASATVFLLKVEQTREPLDAYIRGTEEYLAEHVEAAGEQSWLGRNHAKLAGRWAKIKVSFFRFRCFKEACQPSLITF